MLETKQYKAGEVIFREGEYGTCMYRIVKGTVGIFHELDSKNRKKLTDLAEGRFFGEIGMIEYCARTSTAEAVTDVEVEVIENDDFSDYLVNHTEEMFPVLDAICVRVRELTCDYEELCKDLAEYAGEEGIGVEPSLVEKIMAFARLGKVFANNK